MTNPGAITVLAFLVTYLIHSTLLLGAAWALTRYVVRSEVWRETLWKAALIGGLATSVVAQGAPWTPLRVALPVLPSDAFRIPVASISTQDPTSTDHPIPTEHSRSGERAPSAEAAVPGAASTHVDVIDGRAAGDDAPVVAEPSANANSDLSGAADGSGAWRTAATTGLASWPITALAVWSVVALLLLGRLAWRHIQLGRMLRGRRVVTEPEALSLLAELRRMAGVWVPVGLTSTGAVASPLVLGRWEICVPERFLTQLGRDEQRAALAHELGHLARRDPVWLFGAMLLECVFFFQPLQRIARRRLRETAEYRADIWAVRVAGGRLSLARCLAEVAAWVAPAPHPALAERVAMAEGGSPLLSRVSRLLEWRPEPEPRTGLRLSAGVALIAAGAALAPSVGMADVEQPASLGTAHVEQPGSAPEWATPAGTSNDEDADQDTLEILRLDGPALEGDSFVARLNAAGRDAGRRPYWVAYAMPASTAADLVIDSEPWSERNVRGRGVADVLGLETGRGGAYGGEVIMFAQLQPQGAATRVVRLAARGPTLGLNLSGRVYWLGQAGSEESFRWLRDIYNAVPDRRIRETAVDVIGLHPTPLAESFLRRVIDTSDDRNIREQAVEGLAHHPSDEVLALLVRLAETDGDRRIAGEAAETIGSLDHRGAAGALRGLVRSGAADVREESLESLVHRGDTALAALLLEIALNDPDSGMRREAVELMGELAPAVAVPLLRRVVFEANNDIAARQAVETLAELGTADAFGVLEELGDAEVPETVAFQAVESIAHFDAQRAGPLLERLASRHPSLKVRRQARAELLDMRGHAADATTLLNMALDEDEPAMRRDAVERIAKLPAAEAVRLLRRVAFESGDGTAERQAAESLGDVGTAAALEVLDEIIARNPGEDASFQAVESIAENFPRELALPRLTRIAREHPSSRVRREALDQLRDLGGGP